MPLHSTVIDNIGELCSRDWDALTGTGQPFLRHAFLDALERHGRVGERWGWLPRHLLLHDGERLVAAMPQYLKTNGYGELVFDRDWAEAYRRPGARRGRHRPCPDQGLDYCIRHGLQRFNPGAQGEHKISRGFLPIATWSAHWIADTEFRHAIADFLQRETLAMQAHMETPGKHSPFKADDARTNTCVD